MQTRPSLLKNTKLELNEKSNDNEDIANKSDSLELNSLVTFKISNGVGEKPQTQLGETTK